MAASCVAETSGAASSAIVSEEEQMLAIQKEQFRDQVFDLQQAVDCAVRDGVLARDESECFHQHSVGLYSRTLFMPAGSFIVGKIHKFAHQNIISRGRIRVQTESGYTVYDATHSPVFFISEPETKRVVFAETHTVWTTLHPTGLDYIEDDLSVLEKMFIAENYEQLKISEGAH